MLKGKFLHKTLLIPGLVLSLILAGCGAPDAVQTDAEIDPGTPVEVQQLKRTAIRNELTYIGQVEAQKTISVVNKISAEVQQVFFDVGDTVQAGDVLFTVDAKDIQDQIMQLQAAADQTDIAIQQALYGLDVAKEGSVQERLTAIQQYEAAISAGRYGSQSARKAREIYDDSREYYEDLADATYSAWQSAQNDLLILQGKRTNGDDSITEAILWEQQKLVDSAWSNYLQALAGHDSAQTQYEANRITANSAESSLDIAYESYEAYQDYVEEARERSIRNAEFGVMTAEAAQNSTQVQLSIAQSNLGNAVVTTPISGVISARALEPGQWISAGLTPVTIVQMDTVHVQVGVSETLINTISAGDAVQVLVQSVSDEPLTGTVYSVSPAAGTGSTYPVRVELPNPDGTLKPGMFSQVSFVQDEKDNTFVVDKNVVLTDENSQYVYIVQEGLAKKVIVETGLANGTEIEIVGGVSAGNYIVVVGQEYLRDGEPVNIVKVDGNAVDPDAIALAETPVLEQDPEEEEADEDADADTEEEEAEDTAASDASAEAARTVETPQVQVQQPAVTTETAQTPPETEQEAEETQSAAGAAPPAQKPVEERSLFDGFERDPERVAEEEGDPFAAMRYGVNIVEKD